MQVGACLKVSDGAAGVAETDFKVITGVDGVDDCKKKCTDAADSCKAVEWINNSICRHWSTDVKGSGEASPTNDCLRKADGS